MGYDVFVYVSQVAGWPTISRWIPTGVKIDRRTSKIPDWQKDSIRWKRPDPIYCDTLKLDCNLGQPILISLTGDARLF